MKIDFVFVEAIPKGICSRVSICGHWRLIISKPLECTMIIKLLHSWLR